MRRIVFYLAMAMGSTIFTASVQAATSYVDKAGSCGGNTPCYTTIQAAIDASSSGDTIMVYAGTYAEEINIDKALTLLGPNAAVNPNMGTRVAEAVIVPTFSDPVDAGFNGPQIVTLAADGITFKGFTVDGNNPSLTSGVVYNGVDVDAEFGIYGTGDSANPDAIIINNIVKNIGEIGVWIDAGNVGAPKDAVSQIADNKVDNLLGTYGQGIRIDDSAWVSILTNVVTRVRVGIVIENFTGAGTPSTHPPSVIGDNSVTSTRIGIRENLQQAYDPPGFTISNNKVNSYVQSVLPPQVPPADTAYQGIRMESIRGSDFATVSANILEGNRTMLSAAGYTEDDGLYVTNASSQSPNIGFDHNNVRDFIRGVFNEAPVVPTFTCNLFQTNTTGVYLSSDATVGLTANNNNIDGNGFGLENDGPAIVNAQQNWWGAANGPGPVGPGSGDNVSNGVDFSNFLTSPAGCAPTPTPLPEQGTASGTGTIPGHGDSASFTFNVQNTGKKMKPAGSLSYKDSAAQINLTSTSITSVTFNGKRVRFSGAGTIPSSKGKGKPTPVSFSVDATDNGTPGTKDTFLIQISTSYSANGNLLTGNIKVTLSPNDGSE
jgi:hypothetical protein